MFLKSVAKVRTIFDTLRRDFPIYANFVEKFLMCVCVYNAIPLRYFFKYNKNATYPHGLVAHSFT
jgi:hypothetical protein